MSKQGIFKPVNRYILIDLERREENKEQLIVLPESYKKPEEKHTTTLDSTLITWTN